MAEAKLLTEGTPAPAFTTLNQNGEKVSLSDFAGKKVVLYFYPKAMTPGCTTQACGIRDTRAEFEKRNTVVLGVSPDAPKRLLKFIEKENLNFDLLSDEDLALCNAYGVWGLKKFMGKEYDGVHRVTYVIDEQGVIRHVMGKVTTKSHHDDVLKVVDSL
ncbi:MAG: thioredoxin-dependent thiol peroxidase [Natronospirillum sp.]